MEHLLYYKVKSNIAGDIPTSIACYTLSFVAAPYRPLSVRGTFFIGKFMERNRKLKKN